MFSYGLFELTSENTCDKWAGCKDPCISTEGGEVDNECYLLLIVVRQWATLTFGRAFLDDYIKIFKPCELSCTIMYSQTV